MSTEKSETYLTSTVVTYNKDGEYKFSEMMFLTPHEPLRREMMRGVNALKSFDLMSCPWKMLCFDTWYKGYFLPSVHEHHDIEEKLFFPYWLKLGAVTPAKMCEDHKTLLARLDAINEASSELLSLTQLVTRTDESNTVMVTKVTEFCAMFNEMCVSMLEHLAEEEAYWPAEFENYPEHHMKATEKLILDHGINHGGQIFQNFGCSVFESLGVKIAPNPYAEALGKVGVKADDFNGWACQKYQDEIYVHGIPYPVRKLLVPGWFKRYAKFKAMILSCTVDEDVLHLQDEPVAAGCACIVA